MERSLPRSQPSLGERALLDVRDLRAGYDRTDVLAGISFHVQPGEIVALLGANGAGKTTTLRAISGLIRPTGGSISFDGQEIVGQAAHRIVTRGLLHVPEGRRLFGDQTVRDNLVLGAYASRVGRRERERQIAAIFDRFPILRERQGQRAGTLSGGEQQMLAIGRGLMGQPRLLMLDEPTMGLAPRIADQVMDIIGQVRADGMTVLIVEQTLALALGIADRAYVLRRGQVVREGASEELSADPTLAQAYFGVGVS